MGSGEEGSYDPARSNSLSGEEVSRGYRAIETADGAPQCLSSVSCHETACRAVSVKLNHEGKENIHGLRVLSLKEMPRDSFSPNARNVAHTRKTFMMYPSLCF